MYDRIGVVGLSELTPTEFRNAQEKYRAVGGWLAAPGSSLATFDPDVYPQGSMLIGTTVRPYGRSEYDLDLVCQLHWCAHQPPLTIYDWVHGRMAANETYKAILEKLKRCLRLNYASSFHLDILPACPNDQIGNGSIIVPDRKLECWKDSNPKGFAEWFLTQCQIRDSVAEADRVFKGSVEPLPSPVPSEIQISAAADRSADETPPRYLLLWWTRYRPLSHSHDAGRQFL